MALQELDRKAFDPNIIGGGGRISVGGGDDIVKGGYNVMSSGGVIGGRDSYASNRGSEIMIKEAIRSLENDKVY